MNNRDLEIKKDLNSKRKNFMFGIPNNKYVENVGGIIRTGNAFLCKEIVLQTNVFNKAACVGSHKWENIVVCENPIEYIKSKNYSLIFLTKSKKSIPITEFSFPKESAIIVGHESFGFKEEDLKKADFLVEIPQYGLVESLNAATAASIAAFEYVRQNTKNH